jgi:HSP20 family protein
MVHIIRRDPYEAPALGRLFNHLFNDPVFAEFKQLVPSVEEGTLALDVSEDDTTVFVRASLPGFKREDVNVEIHDGVLSINATHSEESEERTERFYRKERRSGSVSRRIALPSQVREADAQAELKDGVLSLRLPKEHKEQPRKVKIG